MKQQHKYEDALKVAEEVLEELRPHCIRCQIAGSIRRGKDIVGDIEIVAIPKPYDFGLLERGLPTVVNKWEMVKGKLDTKCKYTQRILPCGIKLDLFLVNEINWGYHLGIRTGSAEYSHKVLARRWVKMGYKGIDGNLTRDGVIVPVPEELELYRLLGLRWVEPRYRNVK